MEKIIQLVSRMRRSNFVLSTENLNNIVSKYAFAFNSKDARMAIAADIQSSMNDPNITVQDVTNGFEEDQGCITLLINKRQSNGIYQPRLLSLYQTGLAFGGSTDPFTLL